MMTIRNIIDSFPCDKADTVLALLFLGTMAYGISCIAAFAQPIVDEETKVWALKRAYELNGNSMKGWTGDPDKGTVRWRGMIDLSQELVRADPVPSHPSAAHKIAPEPARPFRTLLNSDQQP